jgi:hypothetical protein
LPASLAKLVSAVGVAFSSPGCGAMFIPIVEESGGGRDVCKVGL